VDAAPAPSSKLSQASTPTPSPESVPPTAQKESADKPPSTFWNRPTLTGDWGGGRTRLAEDGGTVRLYATGFYQGQWSGDPSSFSQHGQGDDYFTGGRIDALLDLDTSRMGLWRGGGFHLHLELERGRLPGFRGGALWPVNTGAVLPLGSEEEVVASSIYYSQRWGGTSLLLGKINVIDLLANDPFFGGWGIDRFMNLAFVAPPDGVVPPVIMGGILSQQIGEVSLSAMVFDPADQTNNYWVEDLFDSGASISLSAQWNGKAWNRPSNLGLTYTFSTEKKVDLEQILLPPALQDNSGVRNPNNLSLQFGHTLFPSKVRPGKGIGLYGKVAGTSGNPNPISWSFVGGISGEGMFANRPYDSFGIGVYYYNWSKALEDTIDPLLPLDNEKGLEIYYSFAITPWFILTADLQIIDPARANFATETVVGLRGKVTF